MMNRQTKNAGAVAMLLCLLGVCGCRSEVVMRTGLSVPESTFQNKLHKLTWQEYDGTGDVSRAVYILDDCRLGRGQEGLSVLNAVIGKMQKGATVDILPYYGDPGGGKKRKYPFDMRELVKFAEQHGVSVGIPSAF